MVFLDPRNDWVFKRVFGSVESTGILLAFLNDLLYAGERVITQVEIKDPYLPAQVKDLKDSAVDVRARLADGSEFLVEMQMYPVAGFPQRVLYNGAKCIASQLGRGSDYLNVRPVTVIAVGDCQLIWERGPWRRDFVLGERKTGRPYPGGGLHFVFLELPKVDPASLSAGDPMRDWLIFLKNASKWSRVPRSVKNPGVRRALALTRKDSLSPAEYQVMSRRELYRIDQKNMRLFERRDTASKIARRLLAQGMKPELVAATTDLPLKEVEGLGVKSRAAVKAKSSAPAK